MWSGDLLDDFRRTNGQIQTVFTVGQEFDRPLLGEPLAINLTEDGLVVRLLVQTQRQSKRCHHDSTVVIKSP